jgi:hypothetical protein
MHDMDWLLRPQHLLLQHRLLQPHLLLLLLLHSDSCSVLPLLLHL